MDDPRRRFSATAAAYDAHRPDYPEPLVRWLLAPGGIADVVDLGAGTGLATRPFAARGLRTVGVEPNDAMRAEAEAAGGGPRYVRGDADRTGLPDACADLVVAAQAFHWFPLAATLAEIDRLLRPGGHAAAFWNVRAEDDPFSAAYAACLKEWSAEVGKVPRAGPTLDALAAALPDAEPATFPHAQSFDRDGLRGRAWSASYVAHGVRDRAGFDAALDALFDAHAEHGRVRFRYDCRALRWPRRAG